ncbi:MAG: ChaN family lipoprotein [Crocinitomicaceae bacterium]|nr:ChaN family lipoprotein [Crocinitomicaceae bacterium]
MHRTLLYFALIFIVVINGSWAQDLNAFQIYTEKGKKVKFSKMVKSTAEKEVVLFGELHNVSVAHWLQLELTKSFYSIYKKKLVLGAEMFEADNQYIIDEYLMGLISQKNFHEEVRLWPNYSTDYQPLMEFANINGIPFIATNVPRRYANMVYRNGLESLKQLSVEAKRFIVPLDEFTFDPEVECYKALIMDESHGGQKLAMAQALKDATMSHFILKNRAEKNLFLHYNGAYHSDNFQGILVYLLEKMEREDVATISTVLQKDINELEDDNKGKADFIICIPENMTTTY